LMMEFELVRKSMTEDELTIQEADDTYTDQYIQLTKDYYVGLPKKR